MIVLNGQFMATIIHLQINPWLISRILWKAESNLIQQKGGLFIKHMEIPPTNYNSPTEHTYIFLETYFRISWGLSLVNFSHGMSRTDH